MQIKTATYLSTEIKVNVSDEVLSVLRAIDGPRGSFAFIRNHVSASKRTVPEVSHKWFISRPRYDKYLERRAAGLEAVVWDDITPLLPRDKDDPRYDFFSKAGQIDVEELFNEQMAVLRKRYAGENEKAAGLRAGQATSNVLLDGMKCHVVTAKLSNGLYRPVLDDAGNMTVDSIKVAFFCVKKEVLMAGVYKKVNSGLPVMMRNTIEHVMARNGVRTHWTELSLQKHNYTALSMNSTVILGWVRDLHTAEIDADMAEAYRHIGNLPASPLATLEAEANTQTVSAG